MVSIPSDAAVTSKRPPKWVLPVALVPILTLVIAGYVANSWWAQLVRDHRTGILIALSPINRYLLLATQDLHWPAYFGIGMIRHLIPDPFFYLIGWYYGERALRWAMETYPSVERVVGADGKGLENPASRKILYPLAFVIPNNWVSLLIGVARIRIRTFFILNFVGTLARLALCWWLGKLFSAEIKAIADFVGRYAWPATLISIAVVVVTVAIQFRRGSGQLVGLAKIGSELDGPEPPA